MLNPTHKKKNANYNYPVLPFLPTWLSKPRSLLKHAVGEAISKQVLSYISGNKGKIVQYHVEETEQGVNKLRMDSPPLMPSSQPKEPIPLRNLHNTKQPPNTITHCGIVCNTESLKTPRESSNKSLGEQSEVLLCGELCTCAMPL